MAHDRQRQVALAQTRQSMIRPGCIMSRTLRQCQPIKSLALTVLFQLLSCKLGRPEV
jgi:hypothetical protein